MSALPCCTQLNPLLRSSGRWSEHPTQPLGSILRTFLKIQRLQKGEHRLPLAPLRSDPCPDREGLMRAELALPTWSVPSSSAGFRGCPGCVEPFAGTGGAWGGLPCCAGFLLPGANLALLPPCLAGQGLPRSACLTPAGSYGPSWRPDSLCRIRMMRSMPPLWGPG